MSDWNAGYVTDIAYTYGYYKDLNPLRVKLAFLRSGLVCPGLATACELGFGQGVSINIHAAASATQWYGTDFNPAQASFAQELAAASGCGAQLQDDAFAEFASRPDLPEFDYIGVHGIWSWISDENRRVIVDFVRRKLKAGGVLYVSYNTLPGWAPFVPMRHLMALHAQTLGSEGRGIVDRINGALDFTGSLLATQPNYARSNPSVNERLNKIKEQNPQYLAHEYFNRDWQPMHFATMGDWLESAKLVYACSAHYQDHLDALNLTPAQQVFLAEIPDPMFRESVRDFMVNQQFRRDYWVKGPRKLSALEAGDALRAQRVILLTHRPDVSLKVVSVLGDVNMNEAAYGPVLDALADHKPKTIGQIAAVARDKGVNFAQTIDVVMMLSGLGHMYAVQDDAVTGKARKHTDKLNAYLMSRSRSGSDISYLASPVTGGGVTVDRPEQLFLLAMGEGKKHPADLAARVWQILADQGQKILKDGKTLETAEENLVELTAQARAFVENRWPILKALQIA